VGDDHAGFAGHGVSDEDDRLRGEVVEEFADAVGHLLDGEALEVGGFAEAL